VNAADLYARQLERRIRDLEARVPLLGASVVIAGASSELVTKQFVVADPFTAQTVAAVVPSGYTVLRGVTVVGHENVTTPGAPFLDSVAALGWTHAAGVLTVPFFSGLDVGVEYLLTLELLYG
jgi:hypothetical protein